MISDFNEIILRLMRSAKLAAADLTELLFFSLHSLIARLDCRQAKPGGSIRQELQRSPGVFRKFIISSAVVYLYISM
jgi:hypothetical protein